MKKIILTAAITFIAVVCQAQLGKGSTMLGGNINYYQNKNSNEAGQNINGSESEYSSRNIGIRGGYFLVDNFQIGLFYNSGANIQSQEYSNSNGPYQKYNYESAINTYGLFGRYYHLIGGSKFAAFAQLDASYGIGKTESKNEFLNGGVWQSNNSSSSDISEYACFLGFGLTYFVTKNIAVESYFGNVGYKNTTEIVKQENQPDKENSSSGFNTAINFNLSNIYLGLNFYFGGKAKE